MGNSKSFTFEVRKGTKDLPKDQWQIVECFDNINDAKSFLEMLKTNQGTSVGTSIPGGIAHYLADGEMGAIKKVDSEETLDANWRDRERERFASGRYKPVPWDGSEWSTYFPDHFAHIAEGDSRKVAFTESDEKGQRDIQKVLTPEAYLGRFFRGEIRCDFQRWAPLMDQDVIDDYCAEISGEAIEVHFTGQGNADEIECIYRKCHTERYQVSSCMSHPKNHYSSWMHPVRVYALGGELELAYLVDSEGYVTARCLVSPEKKVWGRTYGEAHAKLVRGLRALGYTSGGLTGLEGCRFARVINDEEAYNADNMGGAGDEFVVPYLDGDHRFSESPCGKFFVIDSDGPYEGENQSGTATLYERGCCENCDNYCQSDEMASVTTENGEEQWCDSCVNRRALNCVDCGELVCADFAETAYLPRRYDPERMCADNVCNSCIADHYTSDIDDYPIHNDFVSACGDCGDPTLTTELAECDGMERCPACRNAREELWAERRELLRQLEELCATRGIAVSSVIELSPIETAPPEAAVNRLIEQAIESLEAAQTAASLVDQEAA